MKSSLGYEIKKMKKDFKNLFVWILISQTFSLIFFSIVSKFEATDTDTILKSVKGISTLATTVTLTIITIYAVMIINKILVIKYIGNFRERTYTYPTGRNQMFRDKIYAFFYNYMLKFIIYVFIINTVYYLFCTTTSFIKITKPIYIFLPSLFNSTILSLFISIIIILLSVVSGIYYQSTNKCLITSIILVALIGNIVASTYNLNNFFIMTINIILYTVIFSLVKFLKNYIKVDNLLYK